MITSSFLIVFCFCHPALLVLTFSLLQTPHRHKCYFKPELWTSTTSLLLSLLLTSVSLFLLFPSPPLLPSLLPLYRAATTTTAAWCLAVVGGGEQAKKKCGWVGGLYAGVHTQMLKVTSVRIWIREIFRLCSAEQRSGKQLSALVEISAPQGGDSSLWGLHWLKFS